MSRRWIASLGLGLVLFGTGCALVFSPPQASRAASPRETSFRLTDADIEEVIEHVTTARQLPAKRAIAVEKLQRRQFIAQLVESSQDEDEDEPAREELTPGAAFLVGFDFVPEPSKRARISTVDDVVKEQVVGYYDTDLDKVFIPDITVRSEDDYLEQRAVLAHEVHHALQAQHFPEPPEEAGSSDERIARLSLIEGDAMVAMGAALGAEAGAPVHRTLRRLLDVTERVPAATVARGDKSRKLDRALEIIRRRLRFPYHEGMLFVADIYRTGGFALVDKMYGAPPRSTAQILHPEKYLAGEVARPFADPTLPSYTVRRISDAQEVFIEQVAKLDMSVLPLGGHGVQTPLGGGIERSWRIAGTMTELRLVLVPICEGTGAVVFVQIYGDPYARSVLDGWMNSFRWTHGEGPTTACEFLDPK